jgi:hypothetical protein
MGKTGPMDKNWAANQLQIASQNPYDYAVNDMKTTAAFKGLSPEKQKLYGKFIDEMAIGGGVNQNFDMSLDEDGELKLTPKDGVFGNGNDTNIVFGADGSGGTPKNASGAPVDEKGAVSPAFEYKPVGSVVYEKGKTYQQGGDNKWTEMSYESGVDDSWGTSAEEMLKTVPTNDPTYKSIVKDRVADIIDNKNYSKLSSLSASDPVYKAVLEKAPVAELSYRDRAGFNDEWSKAPEKGSWVKVNTPDGMKMVEVTYKGHRDSKGSSDQAYIEFKSADGKSYHAAGGTTIRAGVASKLK